MNVNLADTPPWRLSKDDIDIESQAGEIHKWPTNCVAREFSTEDAIDEFRFAVHSFHGGGSIQLSLFDDLIDVVGDDRLTLELVGEVNADISKGIAAVGPEIAGFTTGRKARLRQLDRVRDWRRLSARRTFTRMKHGNIFGVATDEDMARELSIMVSNDAEA